MRPSFAKPVQAEVFRGEAVEIPLRAMFPVRGTKYLLRTLPKMGEVGEILVAEDGLASVLYRHHAKAPTGTDAFAYAVQLPGAAVSVRADVTVKVVNRPPRVEAPEEVDFGAVPVGGVATKAVALKNSGGEKYVGRLSFPDPWQPVREGELLAIEPGETVLLGVRFEPDVERVSSGILYLPGAGGCSIRLLGSGITVLAVSPAFVKLEPVPGASKSRGAQLLVENKVGEPLDVEFDAPPILRPLPALHLPAHEKSAVGLLASAEQKLGGRGVLKVRGGGVSVAVDLLVAPLPAQLAARDPVAFGTLATGKPSGAGVPVENIGGSPAAVSVKTPAWITAKDQHLLLKPGESRALALVAASAQAGHFRDRILLSCEGAPDLEIPVEAEFSEQAGPPKTDPSHEQPARKAATPAVDLEAVRKESLQNFRVFQDEKRVVHVLWKDPSPVKRTFRVEQLRLSSVSKLIQKELVSYGNPTTKFSADDVAAARISLMKAFEKTKENDRILRLWSPLENGQISETERGNYDLSFPAPKNRSEITVRISAVSPEGVVSPATSTVRIPLQQPPKWSFPLPLALVALLLAAAVLLIRFSRKRKKFMPVVSGERTRPADQTGNKRDG